MRILVTLISLFLFVAGGFLLFNELVPPGFSITALMPSLQPETADSVPQLPPVVKKSSPLFDQKPAIAQQDLPEKQAMHVQESLRSAYGRFQTGDYEGAVLLLREAFKKEPANTLVKQNLATALLALGFVRTQQGQMSEAEGYFEESARLGNIDAQTSLAAVKMRQGHLDVAGGLFEDNFSKTKDPRTLRVLIDLALNQDDLEKAESLSTKLESLAVNSTPGGAPEDELQQFLKERRARIEARRQFSKSQELVERGFLEVGFSSPEFRPFAEPALVAAEKALDDLADLLGPFPTSQRLRILLIADSSFQMNTGAPPWAGGFFDGTIRIPLPQKAVLSKSSQDSLIRVVRHEATHAYLYTFCGDILPSWLSEGLAQRYEGKSINSVTQGLAMHSGRNFEALKPGPEFNESFVDAKPKEVERLYSRAFFLTEVISESKGATIWKEILSQACHQKASLYGVLDHQLNARTGTQLWELFSQPLKAKLSL
jgi:hypothetical protein